MLCALGGDQALSQQQLATLCRRGSRARIEVYDSATGQRLFTSNELKVQADTALARAEAETARAEAKAMARLEAEQRGGLRTTT